jgi:hypothetical protein
VDENVETNYHLSLDQRMVYFLCSYAASPAVMATMVRHATADLTG